MKKLLKKTSGYKTYIVCAAMIAYVIIGYFLGEGLNTELLMEALALAGIRNAL